MAGVALNGSEIKLSTKKDYVHFNYVYEEGRRHRPTPGSGNTNADVIGKIVCSNKIFLNGISLATVGDKTAESWEANPPPRAPKGHITSISPGTSGSGNGEIATGSQKVFYNGKAVALIGSTVKTMLNTDTTIETGNDKLNISS
ncbi:UNVERIFIED_CONTAM: putative Zn-binding protein involved in type VI secretion [Paenibacillus sp. PvR008]